MDIEDLLAQQARITVALRPTGCGHPAHLIRSNEAKCYPGAANRIRSPSDGTITSLCTRRCLSPSPGNGRAPPLPRLALFRADPCPMGVQALAGPPSNWPDRVST